MNSTDYKIDRKSNPILIYVGLAMILINIIYYIKFKDVNFYNPFTFHDKDFKIALIFDIILLFVRVCMALVAFIVAKRLNRSGIFWAIFVFLFPPISLIILGFIDVKIDQKLKATLERHRTNYFVEVVKIKSDFKSGKNSNIDINEMILKSKQKHQELLNKAIGSRKIEIENEFAKQEDWMNDISKCPACGGHVNEKDKICPNCKLTLN